MLPSQPTGTSPCAADPSSCADVGIGRATGLVLTAHGSVAWIAGNADTAEVWRVDRNGRRRLSEGAGIERRSLRRCGRPVEWREDGALRRATLKP